MNLAWTPLTEPFRLGRLTAALLDLLLPPVCLTCDSPVDVPGLQCGTCFGQRDTIGEPCCTCCGAPFELAWQAIEGGLCQRCTDTPPPFGRARAAMNYGDGARRLVLPFKHGDRTEFAPFLARMMARAGAALLRDADILLPVPLHRRRIFVRRYNQSALLAQELGRLGGRAVMADGLIRLHATASLGGKSVAERREEVGGAFAVRPGHAARLAGRRVLLIDDVMTSGATASACAECLLQAGAEAVDVLVAVRVPDPRRRVRRRSRRRVSALDPE